MPNQEIPRNKFPDDYSHRKILEKAIQKAIDGGWDYENFGSVDHWLRANASNKSKSEVVYGNIADKKYELIFNHDFAKALWGEEAGYIIRFIHPNGNPYFGEEIPYYMTHLARMVIADDPIEYLGENLDD